MSKIKVNEIEAQSGSTITIPTGQSLVVTDGLGTSSLPTIPVSKGGTGLTSLGTANQVVAVNSGATALEFQDASSGKIKQALNFVVNDQYSFTSTSVAEVNVDFRKSITPTASDSKILIIFSTFCSFDHASPQAGYYKLRRSIGGGSYTDFNLPSVNLGSRTPCHFMRDNVGSGTGENAETTTIQFFDEPNTTSQVTYSLFGNLRGSGTNYFNRMGNDNNAVAQARGDSYYTFIEIGA
jgi:hypothetical protein